MRKEHITLFLLGFIFLSIIIGCSTSSSNPVSTPLATETQPKIDIPSTESESEMLGHELLGAWTMKFDPENLSVEVVPDRETGWHFNVKSFIPNPGIIINSWDPVNKIIDVNVTLKNPYAITGYDVRLIIYTDAAGHMLLNADDWTGLYDVSGGMDINPFKAYAKAEPNRQFAGTTNHMENLQIYMDDSFLINFAVDASYPSNCAEPYEIGTLIQEEPLYDRKEATAPVHLYVQCWNQPSLVRVYITCPGVFEEIQLNTDDNEYFYGIIDNDEDAPEGEYDAIISAYTDNPVPLWEIETIYITKKPIYGWAEQFTNSDELGGLETNGGNIFFALNPTHEIKCYNKDATQYWSRDINDMSWDFGNITDLNIHPDSDYIYSTGYFYYCGTSEYSGMSAIKCYKGSHGGCSYNYQCFTDPMSADYIVADSFGSLYLVATGYNTEDAVMWKVNSSLNSQWINIYGNLNGEMAFTDLAMTEFEQLWAVGQFWGTSVDIDPSSGEIILYPMGVQDAFLTEWTSGGSYSKLRWWGGYNDSSAYVETSVMAVDDSYNIFIGGRFEGTVDFDPGIMATDIRTAVSDDDIYISKFNSSLSHIRVIQLVGTTQQSVNDIAIDHYGNVYVCGAFMGTVDFDPSSAKAERTAVAYGDMFLAKYSNDLAFQWVRTWGSSNYEWATQVVYDRIYNSVYLGGSFNGTLDFDPGEEVFEMTATGTDTFIMKLLPNGMWEY